QKLRITAGSVRPGSVRTVVRFGRFDHDQGAGTAGPPSMVACSGYSPDRHGVPGAVPPRRAAPVPAPLVSPSVHPIAGVTAAALRGESTGRAAGRAQPRGGAAPRPGAPRPAVRPRP